MWKANLFLFLNLFQHTLSFLVTPYPALQNHVLPSQRNGLFPSLYMSIQSGLQSFDVAVIGGGPVGVKAALLAASSYNQSVVLIDAPRASGALMNEETQQDLSIGGPTGLFSKALRDVSKRIRVDSLRGMGLREDSIWNEIISSCIDLATLNSDDVYRQLKDAGVTYIQGLASFPDTGGTQFLLVQKLDNTLETLRVGNVLISTGSQPFRPGGIPFDGKRIFDSDSINQLSYLPSSIAITGSGIIAIEYAKIFRNLGAEVTLIIRDNNPRNALMKIGLDKDVSATLVADLVRTGIKIERGCQVSYFEVPTSVGQRAPIKIVLEACAAGDVSLESEKIIKCDAYLAAVGRKPNTSNLNLAAAGIKTDKYGCLLVDSSFRTTAEEGNVYGAGDVLGRPFLASIGVGQGAAAVQAMYGKTNKSVEIRKALVPPDEINDSELVFESSSDASDIEGFLSFGKLDPLSLENNPFAFPVGIWSSPEAAYYGLSSQQAHDMGVDAGEGIALYSECLRGLVFSPNGLLKLIFNKTNGRIIGVHICGDDACELIHYGMELVRAQRTVYDVIDNLFSAVTYHEMYRIAALAAIDPNGARKRRAAAGAALAARNRPKRDNTVK